MKILERMAGVGVVAACLLDVDAISHGLLPGHTQEEMAVGASACAAPPGLDAEEIVQQAGGEVAVEVLLPVRVEDEGEDGLLLSVAGPQNSDLRVATEPGHGVPTQFRLSALDELHPCEGLDREGERGAQPLDDRRRAGVLPLLYILAVEGFLEQGKIDHWRLLSIFFFTVF